MLYELDEQAILKDGKEISQEQVKLELNKLSNNVENLAVLLDFIGGCAGAETGDVDSLIDWALLNKSNSR